MEKANRCREIEHHPVRVCREAFYGACNCHPVMDRSLYWGVSSDEVSTEVIETLEVDQILFLELCNIDVIIAPREKNP